MIDRLTGLESRPTVPKPYVVTRELRIAQTAVDNLRRVLWLSESIYGTPDRQQDQKGGAENG